MVLMNKEDKITFEDLANWLDKPLSNSDIDLINFILTSIENRYKHFELQQKVNQLETNRDEAIEYIKHSWWLRTDQTYDTSKDLKGWEVEELLSILERGKE